MLSSLGSFRVANPGRWFSLVTASEVSSLRRFSFFLRGVLVGSLTVLFRRWCQPSSMRKITRPSSDLLQV